MIDVTNSIGIPLRYDRNIARGIPDELQHTFVGTEELAQTLGKFGTMLKDIGWLDSFKFILTAGTYADRSQRDDPSKISPHAYGIAIDLDGIMFHENTILTYGIPGASKCIFEDKEYKILQAPIKHRTKMACIASLYFGVVLTEDYNDLHKDHIHADLSMPIKYRNGKSQNILMQRVLNEFYGFELVLDGIYGDKTDSALHSIITTIADRSQAWYSLMQKVSTTKGNLHE